MHISGTWIRPHDEEFVSIFPLYTRPFVLTQPVLDNVDLGALALEAPNEELAIVIPIGATFNQLRYDPTHRMRFHAFFKNAMWLARDLLEHTDMVAEQIPLYLALSENLSEVEYMAYLDVCGFPHSQVIWLPVQTFSTQPYTQCKGYNYKFTALFAPGLEHYQHLMHIDAGSARIRVGAENTDTYFRRMLDEWGDALLKTKYEAGRLWKHRDDLAGRYTGDARAIYAHLDWHLQSRGAETTWQALSYTGSGMSAEEHERFWRENEYLPHLYGGFYVLAQSFFQDAEFRKLVTQIQNIVDEDEIAWSFILRELGTTEEQTGALEDIFSYWPALSGKSIDNGTFWNIWDMPR